MMKHVSNYFIGYTEDMFMERVDELTKCNHVIFVPATIAEFGVFFFLVSQKIVYPDSTMSIFKDT